MKLISLPITEVKIFDTPESVQALRDSLENLLKKILRNMNKIGNLLLKRLAKTLGLNCNIKILLG